MAVASSEAARALARARWGSTRLDGLVEELTERSGELGADQLARLRVLVETAGHRHEHERQAAGWKRRAASDDRLTG